MNQEQEKNIFLWSILIICSLVLPLVLIPIEKFLNYPYIIEEIAKALLIFFIVLKFKNTKTQIYSTILLGALFALSESMFYLAGNIIPFGNLSTFGQRLLLTTPLHIITALIILLPTLKNKKLIIFGLILAALIHYLFNYFVLFS